MRRVCLLLLVLSSAVLGLAAAPSFSVRASYLLSYDTNVYSNPMVRYGDAGWLEGKVKDPYIKRWNNGINADFTLFFSPVSKMGLSLGFSNGWAYSDKKYIPEQETSGSWDYWSYKEYDNEDSSMRMFFSVGPTFRAMFGPLDLGIVIRGSVGSYDLFKEYIIAGIQAELYMNYFIAKGFFVTGGVFYDAHLMEFYLHNDSSWYKANYTMMTIGPYIGFGYNFGKRGE